MVKSFNGFDNLPDQINSNVTSLAQIVQQHAYYLPTSYIGTDIAGILQTKLNDPTIVRVYVQAGNYNLSQRVIIPDNKELILTGNNGSNYITRSQADPQFWTIITPTFTNDYCFQLKNRTSLKNGFIDCSALSGGGAVYIDFSQTEASKINVIGCMLWGNTNWNIEAVTINGDRPTGTTPGYGYYINIDCGIQGFGCAVHLKRHDTYNVDDGSTTGIAWCTGIRVFGNISTCQRGVWFDTAVSLFAGSSSKIATRIQGGVVPNASTPCVEVGADDIVIDTQFHDIGSGQAQTQRLLIRAQSTNNIVMKYPRNADGISDQASDTSYVQHGGYTAINQLDNGTSVTDGWWMASGHLVTVHFRVLIPVYASWTPILTLPFYNKVENRFTMMADNGAVGISCLIQGNDNRIQVINNTNPVGGSSPAQQYVNFHFSYPIQ